MGKQAIKDARSQIRVAFKTYLAEVKKDKLLKKQASIQHKVEKMGIHTKKINVVYHDTPPQKIKVKHAPSK